MSVQRGTILVKTTSTEAGIVLGLAQEDPTSVEVLHGWIDCPPDVGRFTLRLATIERGLWRVATPAEAHAVRALFVAHAAAWGPGSAAWVATEEGSDAPTPIEYKPLRMHPKPWRKR